MKLLTDIHRHYRKTCSNPITRDTYFKVVDLYLRFYTNKIFTGERVKIPAALGSFRFVGRKLNVGLDEQGRITGAPVDWGETKKLWKENEEAKKAKTMVYHLNDHSNGYIYKLRWSYKRGLGKFKLLYIFKPSRMMKKTFANHIRENTYEYETQE